MDRPPARERVRGRAADRDPGAARRRDAPVLRVRHGGVGEAVAVRRDLGRPQAALSDGISAEGPPGVLGGSIWDEPERWAREVDASGCAICLRGHPLGGLVERPTTWITSDRLTLTRGYVCVVARRHVVEPYELGGVERAGFWEDVLFAAE